MAQQTTEANENNTWKFTQTGEEKLENMAFLELLGRKGVSNLIFDTSGVAVGTTVESTVDKKGRWVAVLATDIERDAYQCILPSYERVIVTRRSIGKPDSSQSGRGARSGDSARSAPIGGLRRQDSGISARSAPSGDVRRDKSGDFRREDSRSGQSGDVRRESRGSGDVRRESSGRDDVRMSAIRASSAGPFSARPAMRARREEVRGGKSPSKTICLTRTRGGNTKQVTEAFARAGASRVQLKNNVFIIAVEIFDMSVLNLCLAQLKRDCTWAKTGLLENRRRRDRMPVTLDNCDQVFMLVPGMVDHIALRRELVVEGISLHFMDSQMCSWKQSHSLVMIAWERRDDTHREPHAMYDITKVYQWAR